MQSSEKFDTRSLVPGFYHKFWGYEGCKNREQTILIKIQDLAMVIEFLSVTGGRVPQDFILPL